MNAPARQLQIRYVKTEDLTPYANNARTHSTEQVDQIVKSMQEFGFTNPLLIDDTSNIIAGHGRLLAAGRLGMETVPCITISGLSEQQQRALIIADNKLALNAGWDDRMLAFELEAIGDMAELTGFSEEEIVGLLAGGTGEGPSAEEVRLTLAERFGIPPFTVLNARAGWWQDRKAAWIALGIKSEVGRGETAGSKLTMSDTVQKLKPHADQALKHSRKNNATAGRHAMPAANYGKTGKRGNGRGRPTDLI